LWFDSQIMHASILHCAGLQLTNSIALLLICFQLAKQLWFDLQMIMIIYVELYTNTLVEYRARPWQTRTTNYFIYADFVVPSYTHGFVQSNVIMFNLAKGRAVEMASPAW